MFFTNDKNFFSGHRLQFLLALSYGSVSSFIQCIYLARLSLNNMVLTMNLVMTQRHENFCVGTDCSD